MVGGDEAGAVPVEARLDGDTPMVRGLDGRPTRIRRTTTAGPARSPGGARDVIRRARNPERQRLEQRRMWSEKLMTAAVPGMTQADADLLAGLGAERIGYPLVEQYAWLLASGWTAANIARLVRQFTIDPGSLDQTGWEHVAQGAPWRDDPAEVAAFARLDCPADVLRQLRGEIVTNRAGHPLSFWREIAAAVGRHGGASGVCRVVRLAGWTVPNIRQLVAGFTAANPQARALSSWLRLAELPAAANQQVTITSVARGFVGWKPDHLVALLTQWLLNPGARPITGWEGIATAHQSLVGKPTSVATLARIANGWTDGGLARLALAFGANAGGRDVAGWVHIAGVGGIADLDVPATEFSRLGKGWDDTHAAALAALFLAGNGARTAAEWRQIAGSDPGLDDQEDIVARLARGGWTVAEAGPFVANYSTGAAWQASLAALLGVVNASADARALITAGWGAADCGTLMTSAMRAAGGAGGAPGVAALIGTAGLPAASLAMGGTWVQHNRLGGFIGGCASSAAPGPALVVLMNHVGFAAASWGAVSGGWTGTDVGKFCGGAVLRGMAPADMVATLITPGNQTVLTRLSAPGQTSKGDLGEIVGQATAAGVPQAWLQAATTPGNVPAVITALGAAGLTARQIGELLQGVHQSTLGANLFAPLVTEAGFAATVQPWVGAGFTGLEAGQIVGFARVEHATPAQIVSFMGTAGAAAACFALRAWTAPQLGETIGFVKHAPGPPTDAEFVSVFQICLPFVNRGAPLNCTALNVRRMAGGAACGAPTYATLIARAPTFGQHWTGPVARGNAELAHAIVATAEPWRRVRLAVTAERQQHVEQNHTYVYTLWDYDTLMRQGANGDITFYGHTVNIANKLTGHVAGGAQGYARRARGFVQGPAGTDTIGVENAGGAGNLLPGGHGQREHDAALTQCYATNGVAVNGKTLVAIGRLLGQM